MANNPKGLDQTVSENATYLHDFKALYNIPRGTNVAMDVGAGAYGGMSNVYQAKQWILIDPLMEDYKKVVQQHPWHISLRSEGEKIEWADGTIHVAFSCNALEHGVNRKKCLAEIKRVLVPGGIFCLWVHCYSKEQLSEYHRMAIESGTLINELKSTGMILHGYMVKNLTDRKVLVAVMTKK